MKKDSLSIVFTGGNGRFAKIFKKNINKYKIFYPSKKELNVKNLFSIKNYIKKIKPKYFIHCAALSRPMSIHGKNIEKSIDTNIIGTCNIVKACSEFNIKLIYFSSNYVYPGLVGNYDEKSPVLPINKYAWSKLGGESAVHLYKNSLILRICMTEKPFVHKEAFTDLKLNFMFHEELANNLLKLINLKGILNVGGISQTVYNFVKSHSPNIKKTLAKKMLGRKFPLNQSMNVSKFTKIKK
tara:strand:- start:16 stop:735 length:720 start_codon:yes stop_codon:yes gene_type:complete